MPHTGKYNSALSKNGLLMALAIVVLAGTGKTYGQDLQADNMLLYQRSVGGWPKHIGNQKIDYKKVLTEGEKAELIDDASINDATIDNDATNKEIRYLVKAYRETSNQKYLAAAEKGIRYLLKAQYTNGGWPQFYPDTSIYRSEVTYNDNAMVNTLNVLNDVALKTNGLDVVDPSLVEPARNAVQKGIDCILKTQVVVNGKLTAWCAQYDWRTLQPAKARSYELPSLSGNESVGIIKFLMHIPHPSPQVKTAVTSAVEWLTAVEIKGYKFERVKDSSLQKGSDKLLVPDPSSTIWARFYEIQTNEPFFCGRDGIKKKTVKEIEYERRNGYAWYGTWPREVVGKEYQKWLTKNS